MGRISSARGHARMFVLVAGVRRTSASAAVAAVGTAIAVSTTAVAAVATAAAGPARPVTAISAAAIAARNYDTLAQVQLRTGVGTLRSTTLPSAIIVSAAINAGCISPIL